CDAGMVGARLPEHVLTLHAVVADKDVLQRVIEGVPDMERARHVGRRDDDGERLGTGPRTCPGLEGFGFEPRLVDAVLDRAGFVVLFEHRYVQPEWPAGTLCPRRA